VGELWRRVVAKRLAHDLRQAAQAIFLNARQFGIAMPCGTDALVHFRATLEEALRADDNEALAVLDLDLRNAFPSLEWDAIRASVARHMPSLLPWITWSHGQPSPVHLPSGGVKWVDRGAEQGDPLGSILCGLVVIDVMIRTRARVQKCLEDEDGYAHLSHDVVLRLFDAWFMDDGQVVLPPNLVDLFLRALDEELAAVGATRGQGEGVKSVARLVGSPRAVAAVDGAWATDYVRSTCRMPASTVPPHVLGVDVGGGAVATAQFMEVAAAAEEVQDAIGNIGDSAVELVLTRRCADVCKVTHLLRAHGPLIDAEALEWFDERTQVALARSLGTSLRREASVQAALGVQDGGLGLRRAVDVVAPAYIAARVLTRPLVMMLAQALRCEGLAPASFEHMFDARVVHAVGIFTDRLPPEFESRVRDMIVDATAGAEEALRAMLRGRRQPSAARGDGPSAGHDPSAALVMPAGG